MRQKSSERGRVRMMRKVLNMVRSSEQGPGPVGSAVTFTYIALYYSVVYSVTFKHQTLTPIL